MQITHEYLGRFAVTIANEPDEIALNGYERPASSVIMIDDDENTYLAVTYRDDHPSDAPWDIKDGTDRRDTFVIVRRDPVVVGSVGYRFPGLIKLGDLRAWYRGKLGLVDVADEPINEEVSN